MSEAAHLLLIDGDPTALRAAAEALRSAGYEVREALTGAAGLQQVREREPDIVLVEAKLSDISGTEVCRQIKSDPSLVNVFVALFSADAAGGDIPPQDPATGADDYIRKPFGAGELVARVRLFVRLRNTAIALRASEQHYRGLMRILPEAVCLVDKLGHVTAGNEQAATLLGYEDGKELLGKTLFDLSPPEEQDHLRAALGAALETSLVWSGEVTLLRKDGQRLRMEVRSAPLRGAEGRPIGLLSVARDVTGRKEEEKRLRDSEQRFRQQAEHFRVGLEAARMVTWDYDIARGSLRYSENMPEFVGGEAIGPYCDLESVLLQIHPEDRDKVRRSLKRAEAPGSEFEEEYRAKMLDGTYHWIAAKGRVVRDEKGVATRIHGISMDVTQRKLGESALRQSEARSRMLAQAVQSTTEPICITDLEDRFTFVNRAFEQTYGYTEAEILGKNPSILVSPRNPPSLMAEILAGTRAGGWRGEVLDVRKDGSEFPVYLSTSQIQDPDGRVIGLIGVAQDISERKQAEEQIRLLADALQSAQEMISVADHQNRLTYVNAAFLRVYGYSEAEVLGRTPDFLYSPSNPQGLYQQVYEQTLAGGWRGEIINRRKDGTEFPISLSTSEIQTGQGKSLGLLGIARDISERKRSERLQRALVNLGYRLSGTMAPASAAQIILDVASDLFGWDAAYVHLYSEADDRIVWLQTIDTIGGQRVPVPLPGPVPSPLMRQVMKAGAKMIRRDGPSSIPSGLEGFGDTTRLSAAMMYVPIRTGGRPIGILSVQSYTPGAYGESDLQLLQALADYCGDALLRIRVREALVQAEAKYHGIFENATEGIFRSSPEGQLLVANPALARMLGYDSAEELATSITDIGRQLYVAPERRAELKRLLETQDSVHGFEAENYRKDGTKIWISVHGRAIRDPDGKVTYYDGTIADITERKRVAEALESTRRLQQTILENIPDPAWLRDTEGRFLACNSALARFYGRSPEEVIGGTILDLSPREGADMLDEDRRVIKSRKTAVFEQQRTDARGVRRWFESLKAPVFNEQGEVTGTVGIAREMTEHKRLEDELRRLPRRIIDAQEAERQRVARELHDSVNQILASAQMRLRKVEESAAEFRPSTREILARCRDLLVQALEENRRIAHDLRPSDLDDLGFTVACRNFCHEYQARTNLAVTSRLARSGWRLAPDAELNLFRIVQEAFANVEKHARARNVRLHISARGGSLLLKIQDDGRGFDPKAPKGDKRKRSGIGLTNIRERATALGGTCEVESAPGRGTTITVRVPLTPRNRAPERGSQS